MAETQEMTSQDPTETASGREVSLYRGPGFQINWERAPVGLTNLLGVRPYYFNPKYLTKRMQRLALALLASHGIVPQMRVVALENMKKSHNPIKKGDVVWAIGEKYDETDRKISLIQRIKQIMQLKTFWKAGQKNLSIPLGFELKNIDDILFTKEERQQATENLKHLLPLVYQSPEAFLSQIKETIDEGAYVNVIYEPTDVAVYTKRAIYNHPNNSYILTLAHIGAKYGDREFMELLDSKGIDWNKADLSGNTPATEACVSCNEEAIQFLLEKKVDFTHQNKFGRAPLDYYTPKLIRDQRLKMRLEQMKKEMEIKRKSQNFGPDYWDDVTYRKENKIVHGHRINIQNFSDEERKQLINQLTELEIPFKEDVATHASKTVPEGARNIRVSNPDGIHKLHTFWGWKHDDPRLLPILEATGQNIKRSHVTDQSVPTHQIKPAGLKHLQVTR